MPLGNFRFLRDFSLDKHIKLLQLLGALLAIPAGAAGTYAVYRSYVAGGVDCPALRTTIIATMDRNIAPDAKRTLLKEDVGKFDQHCADQDPEARVIFDSAASPPQASESSPARLASAIVPAAIFGLSRSGEERGWVALVRHDADRNMETNFDGFPISPTSVPGPGTVLTVRRFMPVWLESYPGPNDPSKLQGRLAAGSCVKVLSVRPNTARLWAEVMPVACK